MDNNSLKIACSGCGASLQYSAADQALKCPYCGSTTTIPNEAEDVPATAEAIFPLTVELAALTDAVYEHLAGGDMTPDHLLEHATFTKKDRFYVPAFVFHGAFEATWTASFGYDRQEHYTDYQTRYENGHSRQVAVTKTRTVTDWRPVNGTDNGSFGVVAYAGKRLFGWPQQVLTLIERASGKELVPYDPSYTTGFEVDNFEATESDVYTERGKPLINELIDASVRRHAQGDRQKDWHWTADIQKEAVTALVPVCHAVYEFEGKSYNVWVSGYDVSKVVADTLPVDTGRQKAVNLSFIPFAIAVLAGGFAVFGLNSSWGLPLATAAGALTFGFLRRNAIIAYSHRIRKSLLARRRAAEHGTASSIDDRVPTGRPWLANTSHDKWLVPLLAVACLLIPVIPRELPQGTSQEVAVTSDGTASDSNSGSLSSALGSEPAGTGAGATTTDSPATAPSTAAAPVQEPIQASPQPTAEAETAGATSTPAPEQPTVASDAAAPEGVAQPSEASSAGQAMSSRATMDQLQASAVGRVVQLAQADQWGDVDKAVERLKESGGTTEGGDRREARLANEQGLAQLKQGNLDGALAIFQRGATADPGDVEVQNNLAYALIQAGRDNEAVAVLTHVLSLAPDRTSAWANLAEAAAPADTETSVSTLKLALHFSANRSRTIAVLHQTAQTSESPQFRTAAMKVLSSLESVPTLAAADASPVRASVPGQVRPARSDSEAHASNQVGEALRQMLDEGRQCYERKEFSCAITSATNVLRLNPSSNEAQELKTQAEAAQAQAVQGIQIN